MLGGFSRSFGQDIYEKYDIYRSPFRVFINKFSFTLTTGYAQTTYSHDLSGVYFFQNAGGQYVFSNQSDIDQTEVVAYGNWLNDPSIGLEFPFGFIESTYDTPYDYLPNPVFNPALADAPVLIDTDETPLSFRGASRGIPVNLSMHFNFKNFRIGGNFMYERHYIRELQPSVLESSIRSYIPNFSATNYIRYGGLLGYKFYEFWNYDFATEVQVGKIKSGSQFNSGVITRGLYTNVGISIENVWSEYFRLIFKPSFEFKNYTIDIPDVTSIKHRYPTFFMQVGVSINIPEIPRSPMKSDHTQLKHVYTDPQTGKRREVRGQPIWKKQNPKVGQNHRRLWRYKKKNKKKLNPY